MNQLQAHLTKHGDRQSHSGVNLKSGQAERLICDLEAVTSGDNIDSVPLSTMNEQDDQLTAQANTQVLHAKTLSIKPVHAKINSSHSRDKRIRKMEGPAYTSGELAKKLSYFTYYELLYLDDDASMEEIHAAYIRRTTEIRSRFRSGVEEWRLTEFIRALHEAHSVLTNDKLRNEYDSMILAGDWEGSFQDLVSKIYDFKDGAHWSGSSAQDVSLKELLICAKFVTQSELDEFGPTRADASPSVNDGPGLAQILADAGLITFEELASVLLGKALIDRRQITVDQFKHAICDMREHSHKLVDALINQGWLTLSELHLIGLD
jgi:hypothetical protein